MRKSPPNTLCFLVRPAKSPYPKPPLRSKTRLRRKPICSFLVLGGRNPDPSPVRYLSPGPRPETRMLLVDLFRPRPQVPKPGSRFYLNEPLKPPVMLPRSCALVRLVPSNKRSLLVRLRPPNPSLKPVAPNKPAFVLGPLPLLSLTSQALGSPASVLCSSAAVLFRAVVAPEGHRPRSPNDTQVWLDIGTRLQLARGSPGQMRRVRIEAKARQEHQVVQLVRGFPGQPVKLKVQAKAKR